MSKIILTVPCGPYVRMATMNLRSYNIELKIQWNVNHEKLEENYLVRKIKGSVDEIVSSLFPHSLWKRDQNIPLTREMAILLSQQDNLYEHFGAWQLVSIEIFDNRYYSVIYYPE